MQIEPQIRFQGMEPSPAIEEVIRERIERLNRFDDRITSCSVVVEAPHGSGRKGKLYQVHVHVTVPGAEVATGKGEELRHAHEDVYAAIRDSFDTAQRQIEDILRKDRGHRS